MINSKGIIEQEGTLDDQINITISRITQDKQGNKVATKDGFDTKPELQTQQGELIQETEREADTGSSKTEGDSNTNVPIDPIKDHNPTTSTLTPHIPADCDDSRHNIETDTDIPLNTNDTNDLETDNNGHDDDNRG